MQDKRKYIDINKAYDEETLHSWYIASVSGDDPPVWTDEHIKELCEDFYVIPKETPIADVAPVKHGHWERSDDVRVGMVRYAGEEIKMDILNARVNHKVLGSGTITDFDGKNFTVQFATKMSKFVYPNAFESFIRAEDPTIQEDILSEIARLKLEEAERRQAELAERKAEEERKKAEIQTESFLKRSKKIEDGFGEDYHVNHLARSPILTYQEVEEQFNIKISGFGRGINRTPSAIVLISSIDRKKRGFVYHDHWTEDGDYIYSGEGKSGDQKMELGNKAIASAASDGKIIHLFVKFSPQEYFYQGIFKLVDIAYVDDKDENGNTRKEIKFRLRKDQ